MARKMLIDGEAELGKCGEEGTNFDFDLFVIGAGSGGVRAARFSANSGAKVGICELPFHPISSETVGGVGGTCVIRGCVPKKILVYGATYGGELEDARNYGWELSEKVDFNWKKLLQKKTDEINRLNGIYKRLLSNAGVKLFEGEGKIVGPNEVEVTQLDGTKLSYSAKHILIATGSRAQRPNIPGQELGITSDEALSLEEFPKRAVVLGGGYIAVEFASIWRGMGSTVHLVFRRELPLSAVPSAIGEASRKEFGHCLAWNSLRDINNKKKVTCDFCLIETNGGITRAKEHQMGLSGNVHKRRKTPQEVKDKLFAAQAKKKADKSAYMNEVHDLDDVMEEELEEIHAFEIGQKRSYAAASSAASCPTSSATAKRAKNVKGPLDVMFMRDPAITAKLSKDTMQTSIKDACSK